MSGRLRIQWLRIRVGQKTWQQRYELDGSLVAVVGPIDRGKTSMIECVDFLFGRTVQFRGAVDQRLRAVQAQIQIGDGTYRVTRDRDHPGTVLVEEADGTPVGHFPLRSQDEKPSWSTWLLMRLGLDEMFASVRLPGDRRLSFAEDLLPYLHIRQEDIDRFVVRPPSRTTPRLAVFKLLLHLTTPETERLAGAITDTRNRITLQRRKARDLARFLRSSDATSEKALDAELVTLREREREARDVVARLRAAANASATHMAHLHRQVDEARARLSEAEDTVERDHRRHQEARSKVKALRDSLSHVDAVEDAEPCEREQLTYAFDACPACRQGLGERVVPPGHCGVCVLPLPGAAVGEERARLRKMEEAAATALATADQELRGSGEVVRRARADLDTARQRVDQHLAASTSPHVDAIAAATGELAALSAQISALTRLRAPHDQLRRLERDTERDARKLKEMRERHLQLSAQLVRPGDALERLNSLFRQIVHAFDLPWATGRARLDPETWTPLVDDQDFGQRGGGSRTAVSVAYSLALLLYALEQPADFHLPHLLILDSPQKNLGRNSHDQALAARMYRWMADYLQDRAAALSGTTSGQRYRDFQLVIVDNAIPAEVRDSFRPTVTFDEDTGFVRELEHPHGPPLPAEQLRFGDDVETELGSTA
ncbi:hypothetical protein [Actinoalloteichus caeruleus]|uniref:AAA domain n=1 Tax=Actinoalloteichus caeruleus DSM 43889 TaxID=1120930 RepID=A0ABT1JFK4_ACTCY|nr:hypothetical protein [Actinoalloteichus caeruleus]MCP2331266.1 hypothetical protein [Actinoalloteichus caeruleus DSM 43889]